MKQNPAMKSLSYSTRPVLCRKRRPSRRSEGQFKNKTTILKVDDTFKIKADVFGHMCYVAEGSVKLGDLFTATVSEDIRAATAEIIPSLT